MGQASHTAGPGERTPALLCALILIAMLTSGCISRLAVGALSRAMTASGDLYAADDDPELIRDALPFALKTLEGLLTQRPDDPALLIATSRGFTVYAYAFVETDAERVAPVDYRRAVELRQRALGLYVRARDYGLRALETEVPGISARLATDPVAAAAALGAPERVDRLFWTALAWGAAISLGQQRAELVADVDAVRALMQRALALDEAYDRGAIHTAMIRLEALPEAMGGSPQRAREHFARSVELSGGRLAAPYVALAGSVSVAAQDREEFTYLLEAALAIDPDVSPPDRLANLISRQRARLLLDRVDELFL